MPSMPIKNATLGSKSKSPKSFTSKPNTGAENILAKAAKLTQTQGMMSMKKLYGNDRGAFLHKQAIRPKGDNGSSIGSPC